MRHFLLVVGSIAGNFLLWTAITYLPVPQIIIIFLSIVVGCLMIGTMVKFGGKPTVDRGPTTKAKI
jgi:hypothetical protein